MSILRCAEKPKFYSRLVVEQLEDRALANTILQVIGSSLLGPTLVLLNDTDSLSEVAVVRDVTTEHGIQQPFLSSIEPSTSRYDYTFLGGRSAAGEAGGGTVAQNTDHVDSRATQHKDADLDALTTSSLNTILSNSSQRGHSNDAVSQSNASSTNVATAGTASAGGGAAPAGGAVLASQSTIANQASISVLSSVERTLSGDAVAPSKSHEAAAPSFGPAAPAAGSIADTSSVLNKYGQLPLRFEPNLGQVSASQVQFVSRGDGYALFLSSTGAELVLSSNGTAPSQPADVISSKHAALTNALGGIRLQGHSHNVPPSSDTALTMDFVGTKGSAQLLGINKLQTETNYFIGNDPSHWHAGVPNYGGVEYQGIYDGIDLIYYGNGDRQLEYDFIVHPGADPGRIQFAVHGSAGMTLDPQGNLHVHTTSGDVVQKAPNLYQFAGNTKQQVQGAFLLLAGDRVAFQVGPHDSTIPLYIDPTLNYSTFLGGTGYDDGRAIAVDSMGDAFLTGLTESIDFPTTPGVVQPSWFKGEFNTAFVSEMSSDGSALIYSTYLGGTPDGDEWQPGQGIAVDPAGNAYVTGHTTAFDFPTTPGAFCPTNDNPSGVVSAFVTKLDPTGNLGYSTYLHGQPSGGSAGSAIAVDSFGCAYVAGGAGTNFPLVNAFQSTEGTGSMAFISKLSADGSSLLYSSYLGGTTGSTYVSGVAVDALRNVYLTGVTGSPDFPTLNPIQANLRGTNNAFVTKVNTAGSAIVYSTYLGGSNSDGAYAIAVDEDGNSYVTGYTTSVDFPAAGALQGVEDAFVTRINAAGTAIDFSTYYGGSGSDEGTGIAVDWFHNVYICGGTNSSDLPLVGAQQDHLAGQWNAFVAEFDPVGDGLVNATYWGGSVSDWANGIAILADPTDPSTDSVFLTGEATSPDFPLINPQFSTLQGTADAWAARLRAAFVPVIDVIPNAESWETNQNSEPSIAVSPSNPQNKVIGSFGSILQRNPYFTSTDGSGRGWDHFDFNNYGFNDTTVSWSPNGPSYAAFMWSQPFVPRWTTEVDVSPNPQVNNPNANTYKTVAGSAMTANNYNIDQPHIAVSASGANDQVFVGVNDLNQTTNAFMRAYLAAPPQGAGGNGRSAAVRLSRNAQAQASVWQTVVVETGNPGAGADGPVYVAAQGNRVYALFSRYNAAVGAAPNSDFTGDLVIVRDDAAGANGFNNLNVNVLQNVTFPVFATRLGANQRLTGSSLSVAVDPNNSNNVYVAYTDVNAANQPQVHVMFSNNAGQNWNAVNNNAFNNKLVNAALPALAVSNNGTVGLLYTRFNNGNLETHFARSRNNFGNFDDGTLERFPDGNPPRLADPYIGEYEGLTALGNRFYGTFSGSNDPKLVNFPRGVYYQRNVQVPAGGPTKSNFVLNANGQLVDTGNPPGAVANSIDPFYFYAPQL